MRALLLFLACALFSDRQTIYHSLDQTSLSQLFAFHQLYPETPEGHAALTRVWSLVNKHRKERAGTDALTLPKLDIHTIINLVNRKAMESPDNLSPQNLSHLQHLCNHLTNRKLKGHKVWDTKEMEKLPSEEIDLARALLLSQFRDDSLKIEQYEAALDVMAVQILAHLEPSATEREKVHAINTFIFHEMAYRFPPQSLFAKEIDYYTMLPSVLDNRKGVCLGVSILYLCIAQRLDLPLEIITPPGHIYLRHGDLNIETTARGIHIPSERYLGINTRSLQRRTMKEVVGLAFVNQASLAWHKRDFPAAIDLYEKALPYTPDDPLLKMLLGINYTLYGKDRAGRKLFSEIAGKPFDDAVYPESVPEDYLAGRTDAEGISLAFQMVDEGRDSILKKQKALQKKLNKYPKFRFGTLQLAITYLQLGRQGEAKEVLEKYHALDPNDPTVEYYLAALSVERFDYKKAWDYYTSALQATTARGHHPTALKDLRRHLKLIYPNPVAEKKPKT